MSLQKKFSSILNAMIGGMLIVTPCLAASDEWQTVSTDEWRGAVVCNDDDLNSACFAFRCGTQRGAEFAYLFSGGDIEIGRIVPISIDGTYIDQLKVTSGEPTSELNFALNPEKYQDFIAALREGNILTLKFDGEVQLSLSGSSRHLGEALKACSGEIPQLPNAIPEAAGLLSHGGPARTLSVQENQEAAISLTPAAVQTIRHELRRLGLNPNTDTSSGLVDDAFQKMVGRWQDLKGLAETGELNRNQVSAMFQVKDVVPSSSGMMAAGEAPPPPIPFIVLEGVTLGGVEEYRSHFFDSTLVGTTFDQCMAYCAADDRCNAVSFIHGCALMSGISYRHDNTGDYSKGAVVVGRPSFGNSKKRYDPASIETVLDEVISSYHRDQTVVDNTPTDLSESSFEFSSELNPNPLLDFPKLLIRPKLRPANLNAEYLVYGDLGVAKGRAKPFFLRDWVIISDAHQRAVDAFEDVLRSGHYNDDHTRLILPLFEVALTEAEAIYGAKHPVLGFLIMDLAEIAEDGRTALVPWAEAAERKRDLIQRAATLLRTARSEDRSLQALLAEHAAYALIETIREITWTIPETLSAVTNSETSQSGRCSAQESNDLARSDALLSIVALHRAAAGPNILHIGWIKRATNCLNDDNRIIALLEFRVHYSKLLDDPYAQAVALADLAHAQFNAGKLDAAKKTFRHSLALFMDQVYGAKSHLDFIHTVYTNVITEDQEYYPRDSDKKREVWQSFSALQMKPELTLAIALEYKAMIAEGGLEGTISNLSAAVSSIVWFLRAADLPGLARHIYTHLDYIYRGKQDPSPVAGVLALVDAMEYVPLADKTDMLESAKTFADERSIPQEQAQVLTQLAQALDENGDLAGAADAASSAILLIKGNDLGTDHYNLDGLNLMLSRAQREQGEIKPLARELASELERVLVPVCNGELDLSAFPWLPIDKLLEDPLLTEAFLNQTVVSSYLDCFFENREKLAFKEFSSGHLPAGLLTDVMFVLAVQGRKSEVEDYLDLFLNDSRWDKDRGHGARLLAISAAIDGLVIADKIEWFLPYENRLLPPLTQLLSLSDIFGGRGLDAATRLGFSAHTLGMTSLVDEIAEMMHREASEFAAGPYSNGRACSWSCEFLYFHEKMKGNSEAAEGFKKDYYLLDAPYLHDKTRADLKKRRDFKLSAWLHEYAGRYEMAEIYSTALELGTGNDGRLKVELFRAPRPLDRAEYIRFATSAARLALKRGNRSGAREMAQHFLTAARERTRDASVMGTDPLVRWSVRLSGLFSTYLETSDFPLTVEQGKDPSGTLEDAFFATQFLQTTNTATTFAKLSARIGNAAGNEIRDLQDVSAQLNTAYSALLEQNGEQASATASLIKRLLKKRGELTAAVSRVDPGILAFASLQFPTLAEVQGTLAPDEAILSTVIGKDSVHIWLIRQDRAVAYQLKETPKEIIAMIEKVRTVSNPQTMGLPINAALLHSVYAKLFGKIEPDLAGVKKLIFVPHKAFDGLPLTILLTEPPSRDLIELPDLRKLRLPWLIRRFAVSVMPSMASIRFLKERDIALVEGQKPFFGVGDPIFDEPLRLEKPKQSPPTHRRSGGFKADNLPEAGTELTRMAGLLGADPDADLLLRARATETNVKTHELSGYKVIAFATHGMIANELPGITEPSLLLSVPEGDDIAEDGILLSSEIAALELNADLVILSACNTAAGNGRPGAEGLSGLANSFFFAGARQLVVTHWYIPSLPAVEISVGMVQKRKDDPSLDWPSALRRSILELIDEKGESYNAHPLIWGAHMLVGVPR